MSEAERSVQTVRIGRRFLYEASRIARLNRRSTGEQVEYWARLGRAIEASPAFSAANVNAVLAGTMPVERLNVLERAVSVEWLQETFASPPANLVAAYARLSDDPPTGTQPAEQTPAETRKP